MGTARAAPAKWERCGPNALRGKCQAIGRRGGAERPPCACILHLRTYIHTRIYHISVLKYILAARERERPPATNETARTPPSKSVVLPPRSGLPATSPDDAAGAALAPRDGARPATRRRRGSDAVSFARARRHQLDDADAGKTSAQCVMPPLSEYAHSSVFSLRRPSAACRREYGKGGVGAGSEGWVGGRDR